MRRVLGLWVEVRDEESPLWSLQERRSELDGELAARRFARLHPGLQWMRRCARGHCAEVSRRGFLAAALLWVAAAEAAEKKPGDDAKPVTVPFITLLSDNGLMTIRLDTVTSVRLLDEREVIALRSAAGLARERSRDPNLTSRTSAAKHRRSSRRDAAMRGVEQSGSSRGS